MDKIFNTDMRNLNQGSKFGDCCGCPPLMSDGHLFTTWKNSRIYNDEYMKTQKINDSNTYREHLQNNAQKLINAEQNKLHKITCTSNNNNKFNIDSSNYGFNYKLKNAYWGFETPYFGDKKSEPKML